MPEFICHICFFDKNARADEEPLLTIINGNLVCQHHQGYEPVPPSRMAFFRDQKDRYGRG